MPGPGGLGKLGELGRHWPEIGPKPSSRFCCVASDQVLETLPPGQFRAECRRGTLLSGTVYGTIATLPPKIRELEARLCKAGFKRQASKGSHRKWVHPTGRFVVMSGREGTDAKRYQEEQVDEAISAVRAAPKP